MKRNYDSLRDLWNNIKYTAICIIGVEQTHKGAENIFENTIAENFHSLGKGRDNQLQKAQRVWNRINPKRTTPKHTVIKMIKIKCKEWILKEVREKWQVTYMGTPLSQSANFSAETWQARRQWHNILRAIKGKKIYNQEYSIWWGFYSDLMERSKLLWTSKTTKLALQEMLKQLP